MESATAELHIFVRILVAPGPLAIAAVTPVLAVTGHMAFAATTAFVRILVAPWSLAIAAVAPVLAFTSHKMSRVAGVR